MRLRIRYADEHDLTNIRELYWQGKIGSGVNTKKQIRATKQYDILRSIHIWSSQLL